ncbi:MAG: 50S ribosomal protein L11 methyltransferase [Alicyclobacillaceae bacterium]|nr:50S ribosomal protein L11 methyltransferase [Alicyclobacillaceae bacterium]
MKWWEVRTPVDLTVADQLADLWLNIPDVKGVATENWSVDTPPHAEYGEWFDESILAGTQPMVVVYLPETWDRGRVQSAVETVLSEWMEDTPKTPRPNVQIRQLDEEEWADGWKKEYRPVEIGHQFVIIPRWDDVADHPTRVKIVLEPGMAFGTGTHETTQLCLEALERLGGNGREVLDVGCGTAILSIAAAKVGAQKTTAIDIDPVAIRVASDNVVQNGVPQVQLIEGDLVSALPSFEQFDVIFANILRDIVISLAPDAYRLLRTGGVFVCSGFVRDHLELVREALSQTGFTAQHAYTKGDWALIEAVK